MSLGYLISPALQLEDINGKPLVGGYLVTYLHGTTTPYITYADFDGNHNPAKVPLNARGMAILLADADNLYDVYCYDCHDVEQWSRINIGTVGTGGEGGAEVSYEPSLLRTSSAILNSDGDFQFNFPDMKVGNLIDVVGSRILVKTGFYHFSVTAKLIRSSEAQNTFRFPKVHGPANDLGVSFDMTYAHNEELTLSGDVRALADDFELRFWASGVGTGLQVMISSISVHAITNLTAGVSEGILPNYGTEQEGKVLRVNSSGTDVEWGTAAEAQVQSDWDCDDTEDPAYILNKPTELASALEPSKELIAGSGISLTSTAGGIEIGVTSPGGATPWTYSEDTSFSITVTASEVFSSYFERLVPITNQDVIDSGKDFVMIYQCQVEADPYDQPTIADMTPIMVNVYNYPNHLIDEMTGIFTNLGGSAIQKFASHGSVVLGSQMLAAGRLFSVFFPPGTLTEGDKFKFIVRAVYIELTGVNQ